jgi:hypothetical protein
MIPTFGSINSTRNLDAIHYHKLTAMLYHCIAMISSATLLMSFTDSSVQSVATEVPALGGMRTFKSRIIDLNKSWERATVRMVFSRNDVRCDSPTAAGSAHSQNINNYLSGYFCLWKRLDFLPAGTISRGLYFPEIGTEFLLDFCFDNRADKHYNIKRNIIGEQYYDAYPY